MSQEKSSTKLEEGGRREEDPVPQEQLGLDPLFWTALVARVNALHRRVVCHEKFPDLYLYDGKRPFRRVEVVGRITMVSEGSQNIRYMVDDASGAIECIQWKPGHSMALGEKAQLGDLIRLTGRLRRYDMEMKIKVEEMAVLMDPNEESLHWIQAHVLEQQVYKRAFIPREEDVEEASRAWERYERALGRRN